METDMSDRCVTELKVTELERLERLSKETSYGDRITYKCELLRLAPSLLAVAKAAEKMMDARARYAQGTSHIPGETERDLRAALAALAGKEL
jgi:hypothetical protein